MSSIKNFSWLHLTDLHFGQPGQRQFLPSVRQRFFEDLHDLHDLSGPWDTVFFTGDLVFSGEDFSKLESEFLSRLWAALEELGSGEAILLAIPGNHDLVRPNLKPPKPAVRILLDKDGFNKIAEEFWSDPKCEYRKVCSDCLSNYQNWWKKTRFRQGIQVQDGLLPGDFAVTLTIAGGRVGIVGLNTTFLQMADGDYRGRLAWDPRQLQEVCGGDVEDWLKNHDACLLLTHHGPDWLDKLSAEWLSEINPAGRFAAHLFGHMHEAKYSSKSVGGGPLMQCWQGPSLFGMEKFGDPPAEDRRHGYSAGRITFGDRCEIRFWPRLAMLSAVNGWHFFPDNINFLLNRADQGTQPWEILPRAGQSHAGGVARNQEASYRDFFPRISLAEMYLEHVPAPILAEIRDFLSINFIRTDCKYRFTFRGPDDWMPLDYFVLERDLSFLVRNLLREEIFFPIRSVYSADEDLDAAIWRNFRPHVSLSINGIDLQLVEGKNLFWRNGLLCLEEIVRIEPGESRKVRLVGAEPCRIESGHTTYTQRSAAIGMSIEINNEYGNAIGPITVQMHHPGVFNDNVQEDQGRYSLDRAFLPGQGFRLLWKRSSQTLPERSKE